jgi:hypothetical protein
MKKYSNGFVENIKYEYTFWEIYLRVAANAHYLYVSFQNNDENNFLFMKNNFESLT